MHDQLVLTYDIFFTTATMSTGGNLAGEGFADLFHEIFGQRFPGAFQDEHPILKHICTAYDEYVALNICLRFYWNVFD